MISGNSGNVARGGVGNGSCHWFQSVTQIILAVRPVLTSSLVTTRPCYRLLILWPLRALCAGCFAELLKQFEHNIRFDRLAFSLHDPVRNTLVTHALMQKGVFDVPSEIPIAGSFELILRQHQTIEVRDVETEPGFADLRTMASKIGFRSFRIIPLTTERRILVTPRKWRRESALPAKPLPVC